MVICNKKSKRNADLILRAKLVIAIRNRKQLRIKTQKDLIFVADKINSVGDYNSSPGGCRLSVCMCPHFFSRFTMG